MKKKTKGKKLTIQVTVCGKIIFFLEKEESLTGNALKQLIYKETSFIPSKLFLVDDYTIIEVEDYNPISSYSPKNETENVIKIVAWLPDEYVGKCVKCRTEFGLITQRKHHCRACGLIYCSNCCSQFNKQSQNLL